MKIGIIGGSGLDDPDMIKDLQSETCSGFRVQRLIFNLGFWIADSCPPCFWWIGFKVRLRQIDQIKNNNDRAQRFNISAIQNLKSEIERFRVPGSGGCSTFIQI